MLGFKMLAKDNVRDRVISEEEFQRLLFSAPEPIRPVLMTAWDIRTAFSIACRRASLQGLWFHDLRHCLVTRMRRKGGPDRVIMTITGHQTLECFRRYDTISLDDLKQAVG